MTTLSQLIALVDGYKPNSFSNAAKTSWVNEAEGLVQSEVMLLSTADQTEYSWDSDQDTELLVPFPHHKLYRSYLEALIDFHNQEYDRYQNAMQKFNTDMNEYKTWYAIYINPANGEAEAELYYLSAYAIAVKHGFAGTEEEWLAGLTASVYVGTVATGLPGTEATVSNSGSGHTAIFDFTIPQGDGFIIRGYYADYAALVAAVTNPMIGDAYGVGNAAPYNIYVWDGVESAWVNNGKINSIEDRDVIVVPAADYGIARVRGIYFSATDLEEGVTPLPDGVIALVYR